MNERIVKKLKFGVDVDSFRLGGMWLDCSVSKQRWSISWNNCVMNIPLAKWR